MKIIDPGHFYFLKVLDKVPGDPDCEPLIFVKRFGPKFPGNTCGYRGTTMQNVLRALCDRIRYLQNQVWAPENVVILFAFRLALWLLEFRAARRHGRSYFRSLDFAEKAPMCDHCGHTNCQEDHANHSH
jgi:hypothetical protein